MAGIRQPVTDYELEYRRCDAACGEPVAEFVAFFDAAAPGLAILDLGCGQGRDALAAARRGHSVHGVDLAASGVAQLAARAADEKLDITAEIADVERFTPTREYDVVLLDRLLHMVPSDDRRLALLGRVRTWVRPGGHVLVADTRRNRELIRGSFPAATWARQLARGDLLIVRREAPPLLP